MEYITPLIIIILIFCVGVFIGFQCAYQEARREMFERIDKILKEILDEKLKNNEQDKQ